MKCPTCERELEIGSRAFVGRVINETATLGAEIVMLTERRERASKQRPSRMFKPQVVIDAEVAALDKAIKEKQSRLDWLKVLYVG